MKRTLREDQRVTFARDGFLVIPDFYDSSETSSLLRSIHTLIGMLIEEHRLEIDQEPFSPDAFDSGFQEMLSQNRELGRIVYDAVKQIPSFHRLVCDPGHEELVKQLRQTQSPAIASHGSGIRIDHPGEDLFQAGWHQDYTAQGRSLDGLVFWSPLKTMSTALGPVEFCVGSHRDGPLPVHLHDSDNPQRTGAYALRLADEDQVTLRYPRSSPLTKPGDLILIDFLTVHRSGRNRSSESRWSTQIRWFNFEESTGKANGWRGSVAAGRHLSEVHPELVTDQ